jgi:prepilin-type N-terminal cleavage/methylation domain-containing protein
MAGAAWPGQCRGYTLIELMVVVLLVVFLAALSIPSYAWVRNRMDRASCANNLRGLYLGASSFLQEQGTWPQISSSDPGSEMYARAWITALERYGVSEEAWRCPSVERTLGKSLRSSGVTQKRVDYFATPFGEGPRVAYRYATQPWFAERGDLHGDGNLLILGTGEVLSLKEVYKDARFRRRNP